MRNIPQGDIWSTSSAISNTLRTFSGTIRRFGVLSNSKLTLKMTLRIESLYLKHKGDPEKDHHKAIKHAPAVFNIGVLSLKTEAGDKTQTLMKVNRLVAGGLHV